jgi:hypothetical protein
MNSNTITAAKFAGSALAILVAVAVVYRWTSAHVTVR